MFTVLLAAQAIATLLLLKRLLPGRNRKPAVAPGGTVEAGGVTIIVPTLNEAKRIGRLIEGVKAQGDEVGEILFVDSGSTDGTRELILAAAAEDSRIRLEFDLPLPPEWVGKAWALQHGSEIATGEWLLGLDADTAPQAGLAAGALTAAIERGYDAVSFAPRFAGQTALERWIQPAILMTLVYRFGPTGADAPPDRVLANGQCFLVKRDLLLGLGGYEPVRGSFAEDVSLARHLARNGGRVGFLDGRLLYEVRSYESAGQMWREWGRSVDLKDAAPRGRQLLDLIYLILVQGLPVPLVVGAVLGMIELPAAVVAVNVVLIVVRFLLNLAMVPSYEERGLPFWLSPLADPLATARVIISTIRRPRRWRSRSY